MQATACNAAHSVEQRLGSEIAGDASRLLRLRDGFGTPALRDEQFRSTQPGPSFVMPEPDRGPSVDRELPI